MTSALSIVAVGFILGMRHATDPDHVIAVTTIMSRQRNLSRAALTGLWWGIGHTLTIFVVGTAIILLEVVVPARLGLSMELSVGLMLIVLGVINIASFLRSARSLNVHDHGHAPETHPHGANHTPLIWLDRVCGRTDLYQHLRPLVVGVVHGLAGSAAVALLVLATIGNPRWAIAYLLVFGVGTVAGMMLITMSIASAFGFIGNRHERFSHRLGLASGLVSVAFGIVLAYQIAVASGLFTAIRDGTPR